LTGVKERLMKVESREKQRNINILIMGVNNEKEVKTGFENLKTNVLDITQGFRYGVKYINKE
jgi:hypothetical protein